MTTYRTDNIQHEYEVAENSELPREISHGYAVGRSLGYEHVTLLNWAGGDTLHNVTVIVPRKSMKAIALLWTRADRARRLRVPESGQSSRVDRGRAKQHLRARHRQDPLLRGGLAYVWR